MQNVQPRERSQPSSHLVHGRLVTGPPCIRECERIDRRRAMPPEKRRGLASHSVSPIDDRSKYVEQQGSNSIQRHRMSSRQSASACRRATLVDCQSRLVNLLLSPSGIVARSRGGAESLQDRRRVYGSESPWTRSGSIGSRAASPFADRGTQACRLKEERTSRVGGERVMADAGPLSEALLFSVLGRELICPAAASSM
jgi:hypothetical protein